MSEQLICESAAEKRAQERVDLNDRIARLEGRFDVLTTRLEYLARDAITADKLEKLEAKIMAAVDAKLTHICEHFDKEIASQNESLEGRLVSAFDASNRRFAGRLARNQRKARDRIIKFGIAFAIILTPLASGGGVELAKLALRWLGGTP